VEQNGDRRGLRDGPQFERTQPRIDVFHFHLAFPRGELRKAILLPKAQALLSGSEARYAIQ
jgi:hypothetical protein